MLKGISETVNARTVKPLALYLAPLKNLLVAISGALVMKGSHFFSKNVFWENDVGYLRNSEY